MLTVSSPTFEIRSEWLQSPPPEWERRLREISPIVDRTSHLRFRWRAQEQLWELYECTPKALLDPFRAQQLSVHWSDLPADQQMGRKQCVTEYQQYMYRTHGVEARRFWVLQGTHGGTPACYTDRERRMLMLLGESDEVAPLGMFPGCPFDERAVRAILQRDKLAKAGYDLDAMEQASTSDAQKRQQIEEDREYRKAFVDYWYQECAPMAEFLKSFLPTKQAEHELRRATRDEANAIAQWRDVFIDTGVVIGANAAPSRLYVPGV